LQDPGPIIILGAGPCGLGAAWRLRELGYDEFEVYERTGSPGGLASSFIDPTGFTWDVGGHVQFSHYPYFDALMDALLGSAWIHHQREAWVWMRGRFIPYPLQNNVHRLPPDDLYRCLEGIVDLKNGSAPPEPSNFQEWIDATFGRGLAHVFFDPYNAKVWGYPLRALGHAWIGERVAVTDLKRILRNLAYGTDDLSWGPNNTFRFPARGGTGSIWRELAARLPASRLHFGHEVVRVDTARRSVRFADGLERTYGTLISTMPVDRLVASCDLVDLRAGAAKFLHSSTHVVGIGLAGAVPDHLRTKCWMYFPESDCPYYRVTVFSNYSPRNVPAGEHWSLMAEVSESPCKPVDPGTVVEDVVRGFVATRLIRDPAGIVSRWHARMEYGYPTPFAGRDAVLHPILHRLAAERVYSRGRFGAWKYEVSNQDHSCMQGVECADHILRGTEEATVWDPNRVNRSATRPKETDRGAAGEIRRLEAARGR
jgi:protoporphyrinogen oxidase